MEVLAAARRAPGALLRRRGPSSPGRAQAMDTAGKDSTIRDVFGRMNPRASGRLVQEAHGPGLAHDYLWRVHPHVPGDGRS